MTNSVVLNLRYLTQDMLQIFQIYFCRPLHSEARQVHERVSRCRNTNIYFSRELSNNNQFLITIQRTHTKIKTTSTPSWSEGIEAWTSCISISLHYIFYSSVETNTMLQPLHETCLICRAIALHFNSSKFPAPGGVDVDVPDLEDYPDDWRIPQMYPGHH